MAEFYHWGPDEAFDLTIVTDLRMWVDRTNGVVKARREK